MKHYFSWFIDNDFSYTEEQDRFVLKRTLNDSILELRVYKNIYYELYLHKEGKKTDFFVGLVLHNEITNVLGCLLGNK